MTNRTLAKWFDLGTRLRRLRQAATSVSAFLIVLPLAAGCLDNGFGSSAESSPEATVLEVVNRLEGGYEGPIRVYVDESLWGFAGPGQATIDRVAPNVEHSVVVDGQGFIGLSATVVIGAGAHMILNVDGGAFVGDEPDLTCQNCD